MGGPGGGRGARGKESGGDGGLYILHARFRGGRIGVGMARWSTYGTN